LQMVTMCSKVDFLDWITLLFSIDLLLFQLVGIFIKVCFFPFFFFSFPPG
jgi:hypothetical protein